MDATDVMDSLRVDTLKSIAKRAGIRKSITRKTEKRYTTITASAPLCSRRSTTSPAPGRNQAHFYTLVSRDTVEQDFALRRQLFLCEQGYAYEIRDV